MSSTRVVGSGSTERVYSRALPSSQIHFITAYGTSGLISVDFRAPCYTLWSNDSNVSQNCDPWTRDPTLMVIITLESDQKSKISKLSSFQQAPWFQFLAPSLLSQEEAEGNICRQVPCFQAWPLASVLLGAPAHPGCPLDPFLLLLLICIILTPAISTPKYNTRECTFYHSLSHNGQGTRVSNTHCGYR